MSRVDPDAPGVVRVTWSASQDATGYEVWRNALNSSASASPIGSSVSLVYDDTTTAAGATNYYWVKATNSYGTSSFSGSDSGWRKPSPGEIALSAATYTIREDALSGALTVTRARGSDLAVSVNYATRNGTATAGVDYASVTGTLSWADSDSSARTITVPVINRLGRIDKRVFYVDLSGALNAALVAPSNATATIVSVPSGVTASKGAYADKVMVYWYSDSLSSATSYKIWRGVSTNSQNASLLATCTVSLYLDISATTDTRYYYWVQAVYATGTSELSVPDSGYCGTIANLPSPAGLQASDGAYTDRIRITWQAVSNATHYEVWRNTENDRSAASLINEPTGTSYDDLAVAQGIYYYYWLKAGTAQRDGDFSDVDVGLCRLSTPAGVNASNGSYPYHIRVVWNALANAAWYEVWREEVPGSNSEGGDLHLVAQTDALYFNDYYAKSGVYYRYKVKGYNAFSSSLDYGHNTGHRHLNAATTVLPALNDYDGDKLSDLALFNPSSGVLDVLCSALGRQTFTIGVEQSQGVAGDYDGDRLADPVAYYQGSFTWLAMLSSMGYNPIIRVIFGGNGDNPAAADFDGDGLADIGLYNATNGVLAAILSNEGAFDISASCLLGGPGYSFVAADFDGDGLADPTVYSESRGRVTSFFSGSGYISVSVALGGPGKAMDAADFDGDGLADPVLYEQATLSTGSGQAGTWTVLLSSIEYRAAQLLFGGPGYVPAIGDYDGDGLADPAIYRETDGQWLIMFSAGNYSTITETFGSSDYQPIAP